MIYVSAAANPHPIFIAHYQLPPAVTGNAYETQGSLPAELQLPPTLREASAIFRKSAVARKWFGDAFVDHFAASRDWETRQFERAVTDWELARYLEII